MRDFVVFCVAVIIYNYTFFVYDNPALAFALAVITGLLVQILLSVNDIARTLKRKKK